VKSGGKATAGPHSTERNVSASEDADCRFLVNERRGAVRSSIRSLLQW
jgi:hypothetical protein